MLTFFLSYGGGTCAITPRKTRNIIRLLRPTPIQTFRVGGCTLPRARAAPRPVEDVLHVTSRRVTNKLPLLKPYSTSTDGFSACVCRVCASACSCWTLRKPACAVRADLRAERVDRVAVPLLTAAPQSSDTSGSALVGCGWCRDRCVLTALCPRVQEARSLRIRRIVA